MRISWRPIVAIILGVALGLGGAHATFLGAWTLIPWALVALALGWRVIWHSAALAGALYGFALAFGWRVTWPDAALAGSLYGFALAFSFMIAVYTGVDSVTRKLSGFIVLGLVGAVCGGVLAAAASWGTARGKASA